MKKITKINKASAEHEKELKQIADTNSDYGFIFWSSMPSGSYSSGNVPVSGINWAVTSIDPNATGNCGCTAATNLAIYFHARGYTNMMINSDIEDTYWGIYFYIGDGPVVMIANNFSYYAGTRGYTNFSYDTSTIFFNYSTYKTAIGNVRPVGILLCNALNDWHWVVGVGYREYSSGGQYARIVNGWQNTPNYYYLWNQGSTIISMSSYYMQ